MISVETTNVTALCLRWCATVHGSMPTARLDPGSPMFPSAVRHLQEALTVLLNTEPFTVFATFGTLGALIACGRLGFR